MKLKFNIHFLLVLFAASLWGTAGIFVRTVESEGLPQVSLVFDRAFFTALFLGLIILFKDKSLFKIKLKDLWLFLCAAVFSIVLFNYSYYKTMSLTSLSVAAVLLYTAPFFVVIISVFLFGARLNFKKLAALFIAFLGCCFVSGIFTTDNKITVEALFFGLLTGFGYALYSVFSKVLINKGYDTLTITFYTFLFAAVGCVPLTNLGATLTQTFASAKILFTVILMGIFNTVIPYILYTAGLRGTEPSKASIIATVEPVVATLVGLFIYNEPITFFGYIGIILVIASVVILSDSEVKRSENKGKC